MSYQKFYILFCIAALTVSCNRFSKFEIPDFSEPQSFKFAAPSTPHRLHLKVKSAGGNKFHLQLRGDDESHYQKFSFSGNKIDTIYSFDWYSTNCTIDYIPLKVIDKTIAVSLRFDSL